MIFTADYYFLWKIMHNCLLKLWQDEIFLQDKYSQILYLVGVTVHWQDREICQERENYRISKYDSILKLNTTQSILRSHKLKKIRFKNICSHTSLTVFNPKWDDLWLVAPYTTFLNNWNIVLYQIIFWVNTNFCI